MVNEYTENWFSFFLQAIPTRRIETEADFISRHLPLPGYRSVVDLCCGLGRHAQALASRGYHVTGVDVNEVALEQARKASGGTTTYVAGDMRRSLPAGRLPRRVGRRSVLL